MLEWIFVYALGALGYGTLELLWRGCTHWSMLLTGGLCFSLIYQSAIRMQQALWRQYLLCGMLVTTVDLLVGVLVNRTLGWAIWDYSALPWNLGGQICLRYSLLWLALSIPLTALCRRLRAVLRPGALPERLKAPAL